MLIEKIKNTFTFLFEDYGFVFSEDPEEITDWVVIVIRGELRIRFIEDRANVFMDISFKSTPNAWYEASSVLSMINKRKGISDNIRIKNNINSLKYILKEYLDILIELLNERDFKNDIAKLESI